MTEELPVSESERAAQRDSALMAAHRALLTDHHWRLHHLAVLRLLQKAWYCVIVGWLAVEGLDAYMFVRTLALLWLVPLACISVLLLAFAPVQLALIRHLIRRTEDEIGRTSADPVSEDESSAQNRNVDEPPAKAGSGMEP